MIRKSEYPRYVALLKQRPEFNAFTASQFDELTRGMQVKQFPKGQLLFDQADPRERFYFVISGLLRTERIDESGDFTFYSFIAENKGFPYRGLFKDHEYAYSVRTITPVEIVSFPMAMLEQLLTQNAEIMRRVIIEMGQIINENENQLQTMVTSSASDRVRNALAILSDQLGQPLEGGRIYIPYPITLIELSRMAGTTRETAGQVVHKLEAAGRVVYEHKRFTMNPYVE